MLKSKLHESLYIDNWPMRRRVMFAALAYLAANIEYLLIFGQDTALNQNALVAMLGVAASIIASYVFGAVWDDIDKRAKAGAITEDEPSSPVNNSEE